MKYTYRDEYPFYSTGDKAHLVHVIIWTTAGIAALLTDLYLYVVKDTVSGGFFLGPIFLLIAVIFGLHGRSLSRKRVKKGMEWRRNAMEEGDRYPGRIVDAGGRVEKFSETDRDNDGELYTTTYREPNFWIDVEYYRDGELKRFRASQMCKNMERFIGCDVDVYVWQEWFQDRTISLTYIDTYGLS